MIFFKRIKYLFYKRYWIEIFNQSTYYCKFHNKWDIIEHHRKKCNNTMYSIATLKNRLKAFKLFNKLTTQGVKCNLQIIIIKYNKKEKKFYRWIKKEYYSIDQNYFKLKKIDSFKWLLDFDLLLCYN